MIEQIFKKNETIARRDEEFKALFYVKKGIIRQIRDSKEVCLKTGDVIGLADYGSSVYRNDYVAVMDDTQVIKLPYSGPDSLKMIYNIQPDYMEAFLKTALEQLGKILEKYEKANVAAKQFYENVNCWYKDYQTLCEFYKVSPEPLDKIEQLAPFDGKDGIPQWEIDYFNRLAGKKEELVSFCAGDAALAAGETLAACRSMQKASEGMEQAQQYLCANGGVLVSETDRDLFGNIMELYRMKTDDSKEHQSQVEEILTGILTYASQSSFCPKHVLDQKQVLLAKEQDCVKQEQEQAEQEQAGFKHFEQILSYAKLDEKQAEEARNAFYEYRKLPDMSSVDDQSRKARKKLTKVFYELYEKCFFESVNHPHIPEEMQEFFYFGILDTTMLGEETIESVRTICNQIYQCKSCNIYPLYDWLLAIYRGEKEPSKNEFDTDFYGYLLEMKRTGKISEDQEKVLAKSREAMVKFEIENLFFCASRGISGKVTTFCPVLRESEIVGSVSKMLVNARRMEAAIEEIKKVDFSVFYREVIFSDPDHNLAKEVIQKEVLPDVILFPLTGSRAMMWQETANVHRDSPARFLFPVLSATDVNDLMIETVGRYRWEICRRIQGMRWNDVKEKSLTSEYFDYLQFYRKNSQLSPEWKEKIKNALVRGKNNYREVFASDYVSWIKYESKGSYRLNKIVREILFRYCPYPLEIRRQLTANPTYQDLVVKYELTRTKKLQRLQAIYTKYQGSGGILNSDLLMNKEFYEK